MTDEMVETTEAVRRLTALVVENGLTELTVEESGLMITVKAEASELPRPHPLTVMAHPQTLSAAQTPAYSQTPVMAPAAKPARTTTAVALESPMVGVFYRSPSPEDPPFIAVGDMIKVGQTIGLIEAMKVYSEVPSEIAGRVIEMPVESGKLVQQGQALLYVEP